MTESGKPVVEMWSADARLKYPELRLFDLSELMSIGLDPNSMEEGEERIVRCWATYVESDKQNQRGNPYKDVQFLEPIEGPSMAAPAPSLDTDAIIEELRAIRELLELALFNGQIQAPARPSSPDRYTLNHPGQYTAPPDTPQTAIDEEPPEEESGNLGHHEQPESSVTPPLSDEEARREFYKAAGPAIQDGTIDPVTVNELAQVGKHRSWRDALAQLRGKL